MNPKNKLTSLYLKFREVQKAKSVLLELNDRLSTKSKQLESASKILKKEWKDFESLQNTTITSIFYSILGTKYEKTQKEKSEYLKAQLIHDELLEEKEIIQKQISDKNLFIQQNYHVEKELQEKINENEKLIINSDKIGKAKLLNLNKRILELEAQINEISDVINASTDIRVHLKGLYKDLSSAENWGTFDTLGGGFIATHIKHNHLDNAKSKISRIQVGIENLNREIKDVDEQFTVSINLNIGDGLMFADYFFDGLIFDFIVQNKISSSIDAVKSLIRKINQLDQDFTSLLEDASKDLQTLKSQRKDIIIKNT